DGLSHMLVLNHALGTEERSDARAAELRFSRFFHNAPIAIATVDSDGRIGSSNAAFVNMFAGDRIVVGETAIGDLVSQDGRVALKEALDQARAGRGGIAPVDLAFGENDDRTGHFYVSPVEQEKGEQEAALVY